MRTRWSKTPQRRYLYALAASKAAFSRFSAAQAVCIRCQSVRNVVLSLFPLNKHSHHSTVHAWLHPWNYENRTHISPPFPLSDTLKSAAVHETAECGVTARNSETGVGEGGEMCGWFLWLCGWAMHGRLHQDDGNEF